MKQWMRTSLLLGVFLVILSSSKAYAYAEDSDPDLRVGFPFRTIPAEASLSLRNQQSNLAIGDIDGDGKQEILLPILTWNYVYAVKPDGSVAPGWPVATGLTPFVALGHLLGNPTKLDVFVSSFDETFDGVIDGNGVIQPGWPISIGFDEAFTAPMLVDVDGDGHDEIFLNAHDTIEHELNYLGTELTPSNLFVVPHFEISPYECSQTLSTPLALQVNGSVQLVLESEESTDGSCVASYVPPGTPGFALMVNGSGLGTVSPVSAVLKPGGPPRIITSENTFNSTTQLLDQKILILDTSGNIISSFITPASVVSPADRFNTQNGGVQPILADLDGDGIPEIILQDATSIYVYRADGTLFPGWPVALDIPAEPGSTFLSLTDYSPQPAVGDIDGDGQPDIVVAYAGYVAAYDRFGRIIPGFPKNLNSNPAITDNCLAPWPERAVPAPIIDFSNLNPAIADIDGDGLNEIIIGGSREVCVNTPASGPPSLFVYDLGGFPGGRIEWSQFRANPERTGVYAGSITGAQDVDIGYTVSFAQSVLATNNANEATVTISNHSSTAADNVTFNLTFPNPGDASLVGVSGNGFTCLALRGRHTCRIPSISAGQSATLSLTITSSQPVASTVNIQVSHDGYESNLSDNYGTLTLNIVTVEAVAKPAGFGTNVNTPLSATLPGMITNYNGPLTFAITNKPGLGTVVITDVASGAFVYTPNTGVLGNDSFTYTVSGQNVAPASARINISINPAPATPPTKSGGGGSGLAECVVLALILRLRMRQRRDT